MIFTMILDNKLVINCKTIHPINHISTKISLPWVNQIHSRTSQDISDKNFAKETPKYYQNPETLH